MLLFIFSQEIFCQKSNRVRNITISRYNVAVFLTQMTPFFLTVKQWQAALIPVEKYYKRPYL